MDYVPDRKYCKFIDQCAKHYGNLAWFSLELWPTVAQWVDGIERPTQQHGVKLYVGVDNLLSPTKGKGPFRSDVKSDY